MAWPVMDGHGRDEEIDWRRWASVLWRRKWWVLAATVLGTGTAGFVASGYDATYRTEALIWVEPPTEKLSLPLQVSNVFATSGMVELFTSYAVVDGVVQDLKLYIVPERESDRPLFQDFQLTDSTVSGLYRFVVRPDGSYFLHDTEDRVIQLAAPGDTLGLQQGFRWIPPPERLAPGDEIVFTLLRPRSAADRLRGSLEVQVMEQNSSFLHVIHRGTDREFIAVVLNGVLDHFRRVATELKRQELTKLRATLEEQVEAASERLRSAEGELQAYRVGTITLPEDRRQQLILPPGDGQGTAMLSPGDPVFDRYSTLQVARDSIRRDLEALREVLGGLQRTGNVDAIKLEAIPSVQATAALRSALEELLQKEVEHRNLLYRYTPEHPAVKRVADDVRTLKAQTIPTMVGNLIAQLQDRQRAFDSEGRTLSGEIQRIPPRAIEGARLTREFTLAEQLYNQLQVRFKEAQVAELSTEPNVRVVDRALPGSFPVDSRARLAVIVGFILSLGLAIAGVIGYERFVERSIQYPDQVVQGLGLPILAVVPNLRLPGRARKSSGALARSSDARVVESFRGLRTRLTHGLGIQYPAAIAITSPAMGDGKSLVVANLALSFADPSRCTVLIDADLRRGSLHRVFHTAPTPGLTEYLRGKAELSAVLRETSIPGLRFIPAGARLENAPNLLEGGGLRDLIALLKQGAHIILIDTPPLIAGVDPVLIAEHCDAAVAVLRAGQTDLEMARAKLEAYEQMIGVPILGAVLNDVETAGPYRYYYAYSYEGYPEETS